MKFKDLVKEVRQDVPKCPEEVVVRALRDATRRLMVRAENFVEEVTLDMVKEQAEYDVPLEGDLEGYSIIQTQRVRAAGRLLNPVSRDMLDRFYLGSRQNLEVRGSYAVRTTKGTPPIGSGIQSWEELPSGQPQHYMMPRQDKIVLVPKPDKSEEGGLDLEVALKPTRKSSSIPEWYADHYEETIIIGARASLLNTSHVDWADPQRGQMYAQMFQVEVERAREEHRRGHTYQASVLRVRPYY